MWMQSRVIVVVPAWDEAPRIARVLRGAPAWVDDLLVVDDGSRDGTAAAALALGDDRVEVLRHNRNRGVGAAIVTGYKRARALSSSLRDAFVVMAGDGQMDPRDLPSLVAPIARGEADYVKGNRFEWHGGHREMPFQRRLGGLAFSWATARAIGVPLSDSQCGYSALAAGACECLDLDALWPSYGYPNDLLSQLALRRLRILEVPVRPVYADEVSRLKLRHLPGVGVVVARAWVRRLVRRRAEARRGG